MKGNGCINCPVKECDALLYRGSRCSALRVELCVNIDPQTNGEVFRDLSDEALAEMLGKTDFFYQYVAPVAATKKKLSADIKSYEILKWLRQTAESAE